MVDRESVDLRLERLADLLGHLENVRALGREAYLADEQLQAATLRWLQTAIQACIDIAAHLAVELSLPVADDYAGVFTNLARAGHLDAELARRLASAAGQRNVLVHLYLEVDDEKVLVSLERLDDFRDYAAAVSRLLDEG